MQRETLRFIPPVASTIRTSIQDDVIPLSRPIKQRNGQMTDVINVAKDQTIFISVMSVNHSPELFGPDPQAFR